MAPVFILEIVVWNKPSFFHRFFDRAFMEHI